MDDPTERMPPPQADGRSHPVPEGAAEPAAFVAGDAGFRTDRSRSGVAGAVPGGLMR